MDEGDFKEEDRKSRLQGGDSDARGRKEGLAPRNRTLFYHLLILAGPGQPHARDAP